MMTNLWSKCPTKYENVYTHNNYLEIKEITMGKISKFVIDTEVSKKTFDSLPEAISFSMHVIGRVN